MSVTGNKKYNAQCEQFKKIERISKLIPDKSYEKSEKIRWIEQSYQEILNKVGKGGPFRQNSVKKVFYMFIFIVHIKSNGHKKFSVRKKKEIF